MKLLEHQGKSLFERYDIRVPAGAIWPDLPSVGEGFAIKAQVPSGNRGKNGGIRFAGHRAELEPIAEDILGLDLAGDIVKEILIEERLDIARELYLSVVVDRDARCRTVLASPEGGMEVEAVPRDRLLRLPVDPARNLQPDEAQKIATFLGLADRDGEDGAEAVRNLYRLAVEQDAEVAEINPLVVTRDGSIIAADAKVTLDGRARFRHPEWDLFQIEPAGTAFERAVTTAGGVGVEMDPEGTVVPVVSGAGLMMATMDLLVDLGARLRAVVDLGGAALGGTRGLVPIFEAVEKLEAPVTFVNAFFQTAHSDRVAEGIAEAYRRPRSKGRFVVRLKGRNADRGCEILASLGMDVYDGLLPAVDAVVAASNEMDRESSWRS